MTGRLGLRSQASCDDRGNIGQIRSNLQISYCIPATRISPGCRQCRHGPLEGGKVSIVPFWTHGLTAMVWAEVQDSVSPSGLAAATARRPKLPLAPA